MSWLSMPQAVVGAHLEMLGRLNAEEAQQSATEVAVGRNLKTGSWIGRQWHRWSNAILGRGTKPVGTRDLRSVGIGSRVIGDGDPADR